MNIIRIHNLAKPNMCIPPRKVPISVELSPEAGQASEEENWSCAGEVPQEGVQGILNLWQAGVFKCILAPLYEEGTVPLLTQPGHTRPAPWKLEGPFS